MKKQKSLFKAINATATLVYNTLFMAAIFFALAATANAQGVGFDLANSALAGGATGFVCSFIPRTADTGIAWAGVNKEIWISDIMEGFYPSSDFLSRAVDMSAWVEFNTINLAEAGVDPNVLINNTTYPVATAPRTDAPLALPLATYDSENTVVRNVEEMESAYDKRASVIRQHQNAISKKTTQHALHNYAPQANAAFTPVSVTSGAADAAAGGTKAMTLKDITMVAEAFTKLDAPQGGRVAVLHPTHLRQLLNEDATLTKQYVDQKEGSPLRYSGFDVYVNTHTARYNTTTNAKVAFGAAPAGSDSVASSLFFVGSEVMRADGTWDMFVTEKDPQQRGDIIGFQKRGLYLPIRNKLQASVFSKT